VKGKSRKDKGKRVKLKAERIKRRIKAKAKSGNLKTINKINNGWSHGKTNLWSIIANH
jgi:hypothetical protein